MLAWVCLIYGLLCEQEKEKGGENVDIGTLCSVYLRKAMAPISSLLHSRQSYLKETDLLSFLRFEPC